MTWKERVREASIVSPSGTKILFQFEDLSRETTARGTIFEFPDVDGGYGQRTGFGPRRYPMRCFFHGANHDREATAFEAAILEPGIVRLNHPFYAPVDVIPLGDITRNDALKTAANQTVVEVTFWKTIRDIYPTSQISPHNEILAALGNFDVAAAQQFRDLTDLKGTVEQASLKSTLRKFLNDTSNALTSVSEAVTSVNREFQDIVSIINFGIDVFVGQPLLLAQQVSNLLKAPGKAIAGIESRFEAYDRFIETSIGSSAANPGAELAKGTSIGQRRQRIANDFHLADMFVMNAVTGSVTAALNNQFSTRPQAINAADRILTQFDEVVTWRDGGFADIAVVGTNQIDTGASHQALQEAVAITAGFLVEASFSLLPERRIVLDRARTIVDLSAELYGEVDARLDQLIENNNLSGSEILELPAGKRILYYPSPN